MTEILELHCVNEITVLGIKKKWYGYRAWKQKAPVKKKKRDKENHDVYLSLPSPLARLRLAVSPLPQVLDLALESDTQP